MTQTTSSKMTAYRPWARALGRLHADERATTLTEFVIILPVFIILFAGILNLGKLGRDSVAVKMEATHKLWDAAIDKQTSLVPVPNTFAAAAGGQALGLIGWGGLSGPNFMAYDQNQGLIRNGHWGESNSSVRLIDNMVSIGPDGDAYGTASDLVTEQFAQSLVDDSLSNNFNPLPSPPGGAHWAWTYPSYLASYGGTRPAIGGNMIYGMVRGKSEKTVTLYRVGSFNFSSKYDVLVAPRARMGMLEEPFSVGFSRLAAEERQEFADQLSIDCSVSGVQRHGAPAPSWLAAALLALFVFRRLGRRREADDFHLKG